MIKGRGSFSHLGFILAAAGSAIGLGNIWKFPYITWSNGGGSFVLIYLAAIALVGLPIFIAEMVIGRSTQKSTVSAFLHLKRPGWSLIGWLGIVTGFVILSYYSVVAGWTIKYMIKCIGWSVQGYPEQYNAGEGFTTFVKNPWSQIGYHGLFMLMSVMVVVFGINKGIEKLTKILMPILILILLILVISSTWSAGFSKAMAFLFKPGRINSNSILEAVGHAFFTLSLGMGAIITYGSYMTKKESVPKAAVTVCLLDTVIALMACMVMFSLIYSLPITKQAQFKDPDAGISILFTTIPELFYHTIHYGEWLAPLFYILVGFAALTSTISLLEVVVSFLIDQLNWPRIRATLVMGFTIFAFGILSALSLGASQSISGWNPLGLQNHSGSAKSGVLNTLDYLASNWMLPVGGILIAIFVGWVLPKAFSKKEVEEGHGPFKFHGIWIFLLRFAAPIAIGWIIFTVIFLGKKFN